MNYIAHIHLAHCSNTSLLGNFLGDFVKGSDLSHLQLSIAKGVLLHRKIDSYTDQHDLIKSVRERCPAHLRRMSGVILDIYFDHLLCRFWQRYTEPDLQEVLANFYEDLETSSLALPGRYAAVKNSLLQHQWLSNYVQKETCLNAFYTIEKRLSRKIVFAKDGYAFIDEHKQDIDNAFQLFYPQLIKYTQHIGEADNAHPTL